MKNFVFNFITLFIVPVMVLLLFSFDCFAANQLPTSLPSSFYEAYPRYTDYYTALNSAPVYGVYTDGKMFFICSIEDKPTAQVSNNSWWGSDFMGGTDFIGADGKTYVYLSIFKGRDTTIGPGFEVLDNIYQFSALPPEPTRGDYSLVNFAGIDLIQGNDQVRGASWDTVLSDGSTLEDITVKLVYRTSDEFKFMDVSDLIPQGADFSYVSKIVAQIWFTGLTWDTPTVWNDLKSVTMIVTPMKSSLDYGRSSSIVLWSWDSVNRPIKDVPRHMPPGGSYVDPSGQDVSINIDPDYISEFDFDITNDDFISEGDTIKKYNYTYIINEGDNVDNSVHNYINNTYPSDNPGDKQSTINFQFNFGDANTLFDSDQIDSAWSWFTDFFKLIPFLFSLVASLLGFLGGPIIGFLTMGISFALVLIAYKFIRG